MEKLMDSKEVADCLKVRAKTVYVWAFQNRIPYVKVNGALRFRPSEIEAFVVSGGAAAAGKNKAKGAKAGARTKDLTGTVDRLVESAKAEASGRVQN